MSEDFCCRPEQERGSVLSKRGGEEGDGGDSKRRRRTRRSKSGLLAPLAGNRPTLKVWSRQQGSVIKAHTSIMIRLVSMAAGGRLCDRMTQKAGKHSLERERRTSSISFLLQIYPTGARLRASRL